MAYIQGVVCAVTLVVALALGNHLGQNRMSGRIALKVC